jgi:hypothetical protein
MWLGGRADGCRNKLGRKALRFGLGVFLLEMPGVLRLRLKLAFVNLAVPHAGMETLVIEPVLVGRI